MLYLKWNITKDCGLKCRFCNNVESRRKWPESITDKSLDDFINKINLSKDILGMTITGGEPLRAPSIKILADRLNKPWGIITSGARFPRSTLKNILNSNSLKFITVSIDSLEETVVHSIRGFDVLKEQMEFLDYILLHRQFYNAEYKIYINTVLNAMTKGRIVSLLEYIYKKGIDRMQIFDYLQSRSYDDTLSVSIEDKIGEAIQLTKSISKLQSDSPRKNFYLRIMFLPHMAREYSKMKYGIDLPIYKGECSIFRKTVDLSVDGKIKLCPIHRRVDESNSFQNNNFIDISTEALDNVYFERAVDLINGMDIRDSFYPCNLCKYYLNGCRPCPAHVFANDDLNVTTRKIEISDCAAIYEMITDLKSS